MLIKTLKSMESVTMFLKSRPRSIQSLDLNLWPIEIESGSFYHHSVFYISSLKLLLSHSENGLLTKYWCSIEWNGMEFYVIAAATATVAAKPSKV